MGPLLAAGAAALAAPVALPAIAGGAALLGGASWLAGMKDRRYERQLKDQQRALEQEDLSKLADTQKAEGQWQGMDASTEQAKMSQLNAGSGAALQAQQQALAQSGVGASDPGQLAATQREIAGQQGQNQAANAATVMTASQQQNATEKQNLFNQEQLLRSSISGGLAREMGDDMTKGQKLQFAGQAITAAAMFKMAA